jgi:hypothetical protein
MPLERPALYLEGRYSAFSGIVADVRVGSPRQLMRVSLNFNEEVSVMFRSTLCPPFVSHCFQCSQSTTCRTSDGIFVDKLVMGDETVSNFEFLVPEIRHQMSIDSMEVSGIVALSRTIAFAHNWKLALEEVERFYSDKILIQIDPEPERTGIIFQTINEFPDWIMQIGLSLNGVEMPSATFTGVHYDPAEQDIVFPWTLRDLVVAALGESVLVSARGSVHADCFSRIFIRLHDGESVVELSPQLLFSNPMMSTQVGEGPQRVCLTRIRFGDEPETGAIVVGRLLTRSVQRVVLNYETRAVKMIPRNVANDLGAYADPVPLIDVFGDPVVVNRAWLRPAVILPTITDQWNRGLVLMNKYPRRMVLPGHEESHFAYVLKRVMPSPVQESFSKLIGGMGGFTLRFDPDRAVFLAAGSGQFEFWKYENSGLVVIYYKHPPRILRPLLYEDFALPESSLVQPNPEPESTEAEIKVNEPCSICLEEMAVGQRVQAVDGCTHQYHEECLRRWLLSPGPKICPTCRNGVVLKSQVPTTTTTTPTTTAGSTLQRRRLSSLQILRRAYPL